MNQLTLLAPQWLWLLLLVPVWLLLFVHQQRKSTGDLQKFSTAEPFSRVFSRGRFLLLASIVFMILALARPGWNPSPVSVQERGRDMIFVFDVSRSMLAADVEPDRITVARNSIRRAMNSMPGNRFGLVVFAGSPLIASPLSDDQLFISHALEKFGPESVGLGGTRFHDALTEVLKHMVTENNGPSTDIVLITDGEDLGKHPKETLQQLSTMGTRLLVIGLGDDEYGARVPNRDNTGWAMNNGREHWSRRDDATLRSLAAEVEYGVYFPVGTDYFDLASILEKVQMMWPGDERQRGSIMKYTEGYPWLVAAAVLLHILSLLPVRLGALATGLLALSFNAQAADISDLEQQAMSEFRAERYFEASQIYRTIADQSDGENRVLTANYNLGTSLMMAARKQLQEQQQAVLKGEPEQKLDLTPVEQLFEARDIFRRILQVNPMHIPSARNLEWLVQAMEQQKKQSEQSKKKGDPSSSNEQGGQSSSDGSEASDSSSSGDISLRELQLAPPSESPEQILEEARAREERRGLKWKKQKPVEQDW